MQVEEALHCVLANLRTDIGRFFATGEGLSLGKGKFYNSLIFPLFDDASQAFMTVAGIGYVLTHECDVDQQNNRTFNDDVLICPVIPFQDLVETLKQELPRDQLMAFLGNLGARNIHRLIYIPSLGEKLAYGGVLYLNQITNTPVSVFSNGEATSIGALTGYSLTIVEYAIENHLLRPKVERLAFVTETQEDN